MEQITLAIALFFLYFYVLGSIFTPKAKTSISTAPISKEVTTPPIKHTAQITKKKTNPKTKTNTQEVATKIQNLSQKQLVTVMSKQHLNLLPSKARSKKALMPILLEHSLKHKTKTLSILNKLNYV